MKLLTKTAQRVDIALGSLCNARWGEERVVQASLSELASLTKIDRRHVARAIGELERAGRLQKRLRRLTELGSYDKTEYLLLDRPAGEREGSGKNLPLLMPQVVARICHWVMARISTRCSLNWEHDRI